MSAKETQSFVSDIYRSHNRRLLGFLAHRIRNARLHTADLAQEVYLRLARISKPHTIREPQAYLFRVARNVIHDHELGIGSHQPIEAADGADGNSHREDGAAAAAAADPSTQLEQRERLEQINRLLEDLPPRARAIFTMHRVYGHTLDEMAGQFGLSRSQVKKDFARAVAYLNQRLREDG